MAHDINQVYDCYLPMLPNLIIIGARKSGTTSLHYYLGLHPDISMSARKELNFFIEERNWHKDLAWYEKQFPGGTPIRGEASPNYTCYPMWQGVPKRMYTVLPDAKLIYILRDPIKRLVSQYMHWYADGYENRSLHDAMQDFADNPYMMCSQYYLQLQRYLRYYSLSRILILMQEDLYEYRQQTLQTVFQFLGVDDSFYCEQYTNLKNQTAGRRRKSTIALYLQQLSESRLAELVSPDTRHALGKVLYLPFSKKVETPTLDSRIRQRIIDFLRDDVEQLRKLTGMQFERWDI